MKTAIDLFKIPLPTANINSKLYLSINTRIVCLQQHTVDERHSYLELENNI